MKDIKNTSIEDRALSLLGSGIAASRVASALGVSESRISQLLAQETFAEQVVELRYNGLQEHNTRDAAYDALEDRLIEKLDRALPLMLRPMDILKGLQVLNAAKRRGQSAPDQATDRQTVVNLVLPASIMQQYTTNINNQVIKAGDQELITMQAGNLLKQVEEAQNDSHEKLSATPNLTNL